MKLNHWPQNGPAVWLLVGLLGVACGPKPHPPDAGDCAAPLLVEVKPVFPSAPRWNSYLRAGTGVPCTGQELGGYESCVHGGEQRQVVVPGVSCFGHVARDVLNVFEWTCVLEQGAAVFRTQGFRKGKGLGHLLSASGFLENAIEVTRGQCEVARAAPSVWWDNPVVLLPDNPVEPARLTGVGTIYVLPESRATAGYHLSGAGIALVTLPGATMQFAADAGIGCDSTSGSFDAGAGGYRSLICASGRDHLWLEGAFDGTGADALFWYGTRFSRMHRVRSVDHSGANILLQNCKANALTDVQTSHGSVGIRVAESSDTLIRGARSSNAHHGMELYGGQRLRIVDITVDNNWYGFQSAYTSEVTAVGVLAVNNREEGIAFRAGDGITLAQVTAINNTGIGILFGFELRNLRLVNAVVADNRIGISMLPASQLGDGKNEIAHLALLDNTQTGIVVGSDSARPSDPLTFSGQFLVGTAGTNCTILANAPNPGLDGQCRHGTGLLTPAISVDAAGAFIGKVESDDVLNATDQQALAPFSPRLDWLSFENRYRVWGKEVAASGPCENGLCRIYDWRLASKDKVLRGRLGRLVLGAGCPAAVDPTVARSVMTDGHPFPNVFLTGAKELMGDNDGLCEAGERCVFTPNLGVYQGEPPASSEVCAMPSGSFDRTSIGRLDGE